MRTRWPLVSGMALPAALGLLSVAAAAASDVRTDLESLGAALDDAVLQVTPPARPSLQPRAVARGYRISGFGAMFVLAPRMLPAPSALPPVDEPSAPPDGHPATGRSEAEQRMSEKTGRRAAGDAAPPREAAPATPLSLEEDLQELEQDVQQQLRMQAEAALMGGSIASMTVSQRTDYERRMRALHEHAEEFRQRVERRRQLAEQTVLQILGVAVVASPAPPPLAIAIVPLTEPAPQRAFGMAEASLTVRSPWAAFARPASPPPAADGVIRNVGVAVARVLETQGARLVQLAPQESVTVAVDFLPGTTPQPVRPARTLLVRVRKADIDARAQGAIDGTEFTKRVEIVEY